MRGTTQQEHGSAGTTPAGRPATMPAVDIAAKVAFLRRPSNHPEQPSEIIVIETHFAWVFMGDRVVRKLKKPIRTDWLDFSTLECRLAACAAEVTLNRPLAPDVYRGVEQLVLSEDGELALDRPGRTVDAVVVMRRLPAARSLGRLAASVVPADLDPLVDRLVSFYGEGMLSAADPQARLDQVAASLGNLAARFRAGPLRCRAGLLTRLETFAATVRPLLAERAATGRVVDAHGDLRPEHVYLTQPPRVLDRLEFGPAYRAIDWLEDTALLAVDLERQGQGWIGDFLMRRIAAGLGDRPPHVLWCFYRAWRAVLRAQLAVEHIGREDAADRARMRARWLLKASTCLAIAERHLVAATPPKAR